MDLNAAGAKNNAASTNQQVVPVPGAPGPSSGGCGKRDIDGRRCKCSGTQTFEVTVRAKDSAWVSIKSDGRFAVRGIIRSPDVKTVHASDQVVVWTGNAGAVEVSFNGQPVPLPDGPSQEGPWSSNSMEWWFPSLRNDAQNLEPVILILMKNIAENVVRIEAEALRALADRIAGPMAETSSVPSI